jgi:hypothetical protein
MEERLTKEQAASVIRFLNRITLAPSEIDDFVSAYTRLKSIAQIVDLETDAVPHG